MEKPREVGIPDYEENYKLWRLLDHTHFMISRLRGKELNEFGLTREQVYILDILAHSDGKSTMNNIMNITQRKHHSVSTQIDRMAKQGLISKKKNSDDSRQYEVSITKRGRALHAHIPRDSFNKTFSCLSENNKQELRSNLNCLLERAYTLHGIERKLFFPGG
jgi:DNA-binding MarR family transcriptional regulator